MLGTAIQTFSLAQKQFCWSGIGVRTTASADRNMAAHRHSFFQVFFVASGTAVHEIGERVFHAGAGSIFFVSPYTVHRVVFPADSDCYVIYFNAQFVQQASGAVDVAAQEAQLYRLPELAPFIYQAGCSYQLEGEEIAQARDRCRRIADACALRGLFDAAQARAELVLLMTAVGKKYQSEFRKFENPGGADHYVDKRARAAIQHMKAHFRQALTLPELAARVNLSGAYLTLLLKQETGQSFKQILDGLRVENAKNLLAYTDLPLQKIAADSGFLDQAHFARRFRSYTQTTPGQFRRRHHAPLDEAALPAADLSGQAHA